MTEQEFVSKIERAFSEYIYDKMNEFDKPKKIFARVYSENDKVYEMVVHIHRNYEIEHIMAKKREKPFLSSS